MGFAVPILLGLSTATAAYSVYSTRKENKKRNETNAKIAAENVKLEKAQTAEEVRKLKEQNRYRQGLARARAGASGVAHSGSVVDWLKDLATAGNQDVSYLKKVGASRATAASLQGEASQTSSMSGAWGALGNVFSQGAKAYTAYKTAG